MKEFLLLFRAPQMEGYEPTPEELQAGMQQWQTWIGDISAQGKFVATNQLGEEGCVVNPGAAIVDGPVANGQQTVGGYMIVKTDTIEDATEIAKGCPIFGYGGNVEVRDIMVFN